MTMLPVVFSMSKSMSWSPPGVQLGGSTRHLSDLAGAPLGFGGQSHRRWQEGWLEGLWAFKEEPESGVLRLFSNYDIWVTG